MGLGSCPCRPLSITDHALRVLQHGVVEVAVVVAVALDLLHDDFSPGPHQRLRFDHLLYDLPLRNEETGIQKR